MNAFMLNVFEVASLPSACIKIAILVAIVRCDECCLDSCDTTRADIRSEALFVVKSLGHAVTEVRLVQKLRRGLRK